MQDRRPQAVGPSGKDLGITLTRTRASAAIGPSLLLAPLALFLAAVLLFPLGKLLAISFAAPEGPLAAYAAVLSNDVYRSVFLNSLLLAFCVAAGATLLGYPTAYMLSWLDGWRRAAAFWCVLLPLWVSVLVRTFAWMLLLGSTGPVNGLLLGTGLVSAPVPLLFNDTGVFIGMVHVLLPYALFPIYTAMKAVDGRLLLASDALGASPLLTFSRIYLPLTRRGAATGFVLVFLLSLGFYITPALLGGPRSMSVAMLIDSFVNEQLVWPLAAAASFCLLGVIALLLLAARRVVNITDAVGAA